MASTTLEERIDIFESSEKGKASWRTARRLPWRQRTIQKSRRRGRLADDTGDQVAGSSDPDREEEVLDVDKKQIGHGRFLRCTTCPTLAYGRWPVDGTAKPISWADVEQYRPFINAEQSHGRFSHIFHDTTVGNARLLAL